VRISLSDWKDVGLRSRLWGLENCTGVSVFCVKYGNICGMPDEIGDICATLKNIVKFLAFTRNIVDVCS
jgi:hypothetical protein